MSTERDTTRIVRSWLRTDEHESADRVLDDVLALLDATPQRRPWPTRRIADMNTYAKLLIAAIAVVVVAVVGLNLLPARGGVGGSAPSVQASAPPSPTASPTPQPSPSPTTAAVFPPAGPLAIGRHDMTLNGVPFTFELGSADWKSEGTFALDIATPTGARDAGFIFWSETPVGVFADPCRGSKGPPVGGSASALASAVADLPGVRVVSGPTDTTIGGYPAKHVVVTVPDDVGCDASSFYLWYAQQEDLARYATELGTTIRVWIIDVDGKLVWIDGETYKGSGAGAGSEVDRVIDSIRFE